MKTMILIFSLTVQFVFGQAGGLTSEKIQKHFDEIIACPRTITPRIIDTTGTKEFESKKGLLSIPSDNYISIDSIADQKANIISDFGQPRNELSVICKQDAHACAIAKGEVTAIAKANEGWIVIIRQGNYLSVYANLDTVYVKNNKSSQRNKNLE